MAVQLTTQIVGNANSTPAEVETNTLARRFTIRPQDFRSLGSYQAGATYTYVNALTAQPTPTTLPVLAALRPQNTPGTICVLRKVNVALMLQQAATGTGAAVIYSVGLCRVESFGSQYVVAQDGSASASVGAVKQLSPVQMGNKLEATMADSTLDFIMPPDAAAGHTTTLLAPVIQTTLSTMIPVLSSNPPLAVAVGQGVNATTTAVIPPTYLMDQRAGELPVVLEPMSGAALVLMSTTPTFATAAGTLAFTLTVAWDELLLRDYDL